MTSAVNPDSLREHRKNPSVLKVDLARIRVRSPCVLVLVLEGKDDLPVYEIWIKRIFEQLEWEPLVAKGKKNLLEFREMLARDKTGMDVCTYFILDHDYDGLRDFPDGDDIFVIPAYSMENYLADAGVFRSILRTDLHVLSDIQETELLVAHYNSLMDQFLEIVLPACTKLFGAKGEKVGNVRICDSINDFVDITLGGVALKPGISAEGMIATDLPISNNGLALGVAFFSDRENSYWVRGKFVFEAFKRICELYFLDRRAQTPTLFKEQGKNLSFTPSSLDLRALAARSPIPNGLKEAIAKWTEDCDERCVA